MKVLNSVSIDKLPKGKLEKKTAKYLGSVKTETLKPQT